MSSTAVIQVDNLGKRYDCAGAQFGTSLRETISGLFRLPRKQAVGSFAELYPEGSSLWALCGVSFSVEPGEVIGVLGRNGAGKSTLLKIISRITKPTEGRVEIRGRVGSLLEVGTGFHPELTGRENVFLSGAVLGMKRDEIFRKFDNIVEFSGIEQFLDMPVKRYSSGMYVRLAFAVAAHLDPDVLIVDEVLAVGDAPFQKKCMDKIRQIMHGGSSILLVSHNVNAVMALCTRALLLEQGRIVASGDVYDCVNHYAGMLDGATFFEWEGDLGDENLRLYCARIVSEGCQRVFRRGDVFCLEFVYEVRTEQNPFVVIGADFFNGSGIFICATRLTDFLSGPPLAAVQAKGRHLVRLHVDTSLFAEGDYLIRFNLGLHNIRRIIEDEPILSFSVVNPGRNYNHDTPLYRNIIYPAWRWDAEMG